MEGAGDLGGFDFDDFEVIGIVLDIEGGWGGDILFEGYEAFFLEEEEGSAAVGGVVGDGDLGFLFIFEVLEGGEFCGVEADGEEDGFANGREFIATGLDLFVEEGLVLVAIEIEVALGEGGVGEDVVVKFDNFDLEVLFCGEGFDEFGDFDVGAWSDADG